MEFDGKYCEHYRCSGYCKNRGECYVDSSVTTNHTRGVLRCKCHAPWTGDRCEILVSMCEKICHNGAKCTASTTHDVGDCICQRNFTGRYCQNCDDLECENHGVCKKDGNGNSYCECSKEYTGRRCERSICEGYCNGHGQCTVHLDKPQCTCEAGYYGKQCQLDSCSDYCENGGTCIIYAGGEKQCNCETNYFGTRCEQHKCDVQNCDPLLTCEQIYCKNGGTCHIIRDEPVCNCSSEWSGNMCESHVGVDNRCKGFCKNNGICKLETLNTPKCVCVGDWTGEICNNPPPCIENCGVCVAGSSINECM